MKSTRLTQKVFDTCGHTGHDLVLASCRINLNVHNPLIVPISIECVRMLCRVHAVRNLPFHPIGKRNTRPPQLFHSDEGLVDVRIARDEVCA